MNNPLILDYIRRYLLGATPPLDCGVPPGTLPALVEGELNQARVATVGINPHGGLTRDLYPPLDAGGAELYWDDKRRYFHRHRHISFGFLERVLRQCRFSYGGKYDLEGHFRGRLACSLDLVQWPTLPLWGELPQKTQVRLLQDGRSFVKMVLDNNPTLALLLGNGARVVREVEQAFSVRMQPAAASVKGWQLSQCELPGGVTFIGWNKFLQRSGATRSEIDAVGSAVAEAANV